MVTYCLTICSITFSRLDLYSLVRVCPSKNIVNISIVFKHVVFFMKKNAALMIDVCLKSERIGSLHRNLVGNA